MVLIWVLGRFILCKRGIEDMCVLESHKSDILYKKHNSVFGQVHSWLQGNTNNLIECK